MMPGSPNSTAPLELVLPEDINIPAPTSEEAILQPAASGQAAYAEIHTAWSTGPEDFEDVDSVIGSITKFTGTTSITSSIFEYVYENGRRYHAYRAGRYPLPNDEKEQDRLDFQHHVLGLISKGELFRAPITSTPHRILDTGTGTGIWAVDFAYLYPSAHVLGTDLSSIQSEWVPPNCEFLVDDLESDWVFHESFDFIHGRDLGGCIKNWERLCRQAYSHLELDGWLELQEYKWVFRSENDSCVRIAPHFDQWQSLLNKATIATGQKLDVIYEQQDFLRGAGLLTSTKVLTGFHVVVGLKIARSSILGFASSPLCWILSNLTPSASSPGFWVGLWKRQGF